MKHTHLYVLPALLGIALLAGCERPPVSTEQIGYRGVAMETVSNPRTVAALKAKNVVPEAIAPVPGDGPTAGTVYQNVHVLNDLSVAEFARVMVAITQWVAPPDQSCAYCHGGADMANDDLYTKVVARRMLEMVRNINTNWKLHVAETGVTCYTCHRGNAVPEYVWFTNPGPLKASHFAGNLAGQNSPSMMVALASLPNDPFTKFLNQKNEIRVVSTTALPTADKNSIKDAEATYGLMMHVSQSLGVNCTYCHNTRSFAQWDASTPKRTTAWYGIRMVRDLNNDYLEPLTKTFPAHRLGPYGDVAKVDCATCHQGVYKPLFGVSMLKDYPELAGPKPAATPAAEPVAEPLPADAAPVATAMVSKP
jgi:photosynthetic reaction center cytochrome c subunit